MGANREDQTFLEVASMNLPYQQLSDRLSGIDLFGSGIAFRNSETP